MGPARAKKWIFSGRLFDAEEALADGVVSRLAGRDALLDAARETVAEMVGSGPLAVHAARRAIDAALGMSMQGGLQLEWEAYETILYTEDRLEALAALREKRKPVFKGR